MKTQKLQLAKSQSDKIYGKRPTSTVPTNPETQVQTIMVDRVGPAGSKELSTSMDKYNGTPLVDFNPGTHFNLDEFGSLIGHSSWTEVD